MAICKWSVSWIKPQLTLIWDEDAYNFDGLYTVQTISTTSPFSLTNMDISMFSGGSTVTVGAFKKTCDADKCYFDTAMIIDNTVVVEAVATATLDTTASGLIPVSIESTDKTSNNLIVQLLSASAYIQKDDVNDQLLFITPDEGVMINGVNYKFTLTASL